MKLKINKACDLSSISVLPPRRSGGMSSGGDGLGRSQASQIRSQSQQSFSQGISLSQLSQSSLEEALLNDQRFGSQEKDTSLKKISTLAPIALTREESQLQSSKASANALRRWNAAPFSDNRFQPSEELEHKLRLVESSIHRLGMILDSVQSDIMQVNRAVKELSLEAGGIKQKISLLENSMQQMLKWEDEIKSFIRGSLTSISDQLTNNSNSSKLNEIASVMTALQGQIDARLGKLEYEVCRTFSKKEVRESGINSSDIEYLNKVQSSATRHHTHTEQSLKGNKSDKIVAFVPVVSTEKRSPLVKKEGKRMSVQPNLTEPGKTMSVRSKLIKPRHNMEVRHEITQRKQEQNIRIIIDSDEESGDVSCLILNKETGKESKFLGEVQQETLRILQKARKRRRRQMNSINVD